MDAGRIRVLLIEDDPATARVIGRLLTTLGRGSFVLECVNRLSKGIERLNQMGEEAIDAVLLDLSLPDAQGLDTVVRMREEAPPVPIVVLTGLADQAVAVRAVRGGAQDYLVKGEVSGDLLIHSIRYAIERHQLLDTLADRTRALEAAEARLRTMIEKNPDGILILDGEGVVRFSNPAAELILGRGADQLVGESIGVPVTAGTRLVDMVRNGVEAAQVEFRLVEMEWDDETLYIAGLRDVTELWRMRERLRALSLTDELTGLSNRRGFLALAEQQLKVAQRTGKKMLLVFADVDRMKWINDSLGHQEGDRALVQTANVLKSTFRESDIIARVGGDEFAVLALAADEDSTRILAERLQENLDASNARLARSYELSVSIGTAQYDPDHPCPIDGLMARADSLMYEHKRSRSV